MSSTTTSLGRDEKPEIGSVGLQGHSDCGSSGSVHSSRDGQADAVDTARITGDDIESRRINGPLTEDKESPNHASEEIRKTPSNILSRVASRLTTRSIGESLPPPDGGLQAWTQVAMGWLVVFTTWGYINSFGSFQTYYTNTLPYAPSTISWIGSMQVFLTFLAGAFSGRLLDAGLFIPTYIVGMIVQLLGMFLMSISTQYWQLMLTQGVLTGIGGGIFFTPTLALIATYFSKRRAIALGLATTGNSAGGIIYPVLTRELLPRLGFAWTTRVLAFVNTAFLLFALIFLRPRLPPRKSGPLVDWTAYREPVFVSFVLGVFALTWALYYTYYYIASFGEERLGLSYSAASILVIIINGAGLPFRVIVPLFADRYGPINLITPMSFGVAVVAWCWLAVHDLTGFYVFTVLYGIVQACFQCIFPASLTTLTTRLDMTGTRLGMAFSVIAFAALTGPPIGGAIQSANNGSYTGAQIWAAVTTTAAFALVAAARYFKAGWDWTVHC